MDSDDHHVEEEILLPGFRFHPTDEELVGFYLRRKVQQRPLSIELIKQLDIYKFDPWDLPREKEWYFYCRRDRKYRNSSRPNRVTGAGFWKATGIDRPIYSSDNPKYVIGLKKSLVFYKGKAAKGSKTDWMMHEFRLPTHLDTHIKISPLHCKDVQPAHDSWTICRIFKKNTIAQRVLQQKISGCMSPQNRIVTNSTSEDFSGEIGNQTSTSSNPCSNSHTGDECCSNELGCNVENNKAVPLPERYMLMQNIMEVPKEYLDCDHMNPFSVKGSLDTVNTNFAGHRTSSNNMDHNIVRQLNLLSEKSNNRLSEGSSQSIPVPFQSAHNLYDVLRDVPWEMLSSSFNFSPTNAAN
eukprot:Gb_41026 [translate_table: standard]